MFYLINVSAKQHLAVYVSSVSKYPSEVNCEYSVGDLPEHVLKSMITSDYMREMLQMANPFQYIEEQDKVKEAYKEILEDILCRFIINLPTKEITG